MAFVVASVACGGSSGTSPPATSSASSAVTAPAKEDERVRAEREAREERERRETLAATHRVAELEQQNAMAASCSEPKPWTKHERCLPSCYPTEEPDARA